MNEQELTNLTALLTAGAKVMSNDKGSEETVAIHQVVLALIAKIKTMIVPEKVGPENPENLG